MSKQAGTLLLNRMQVTVGIDAAVEVDTLLEQQNLNLSPDPPLGGVEPSVGDAGIASRVCVLVMPPTAEWADITHEEPFLDAGTGTVHVIFTNANQGAARTFNVLFWDPHTSICPMDADTYNPEPEA